MKTELVVAGYIFSEDKILLIHNTKLDLWLPLGGHVEEGETPDEAIIREIKEEANLKINLLNISPFPLEGNVKQAMAIPFDVNIHLAKDHHHYCLFYLCEALNPEDLKINKELKGFRWFSEEDLNDSCIPKDVKNHALKVFEMLKNR